MSVAVRCVRRFKATENGIPAIQQLSRVVELPILPQRGMIVEFEDGGRAPIMWLAVKARAEWQAGIYGPSVEIGLETEPSDRLAGAQAAGWKPREAP